MKIKIDIIYEDEYLLILDKPAGVLVHPTQAGEKETLVDFVKQKYPGIEKLNWPEPSRPGIVHRLDKDTSGLIIIAKTPEILVKLQGQFKSREVQKVYTALVLGEPPSPQGKIEAAITRGKAGTQKVQELSYSFSKETVRPAITLYKTIQKYKFHDEILTLLEAQPKTGRMHQIRVHLKHIGHPIIGDPLYNTKLSRKISKGLDLNRQFLHASKLEFTHPITDKILQFDSELPKDLKNIMVKI